MMTTMMSRYHRPAVVSHIIIISIIIRMCITRRVTVEEENKIEREKSKDS